MRTDFKALDTFTYRELQRIAYAVTRTVPRVVVDHHVVQLRQLRFFQSGEKTEGSPHSHSCYESIIVLRGEITYKDAVKSASLEMGDFQLYEPNATHFWETHEAPCLRMITWFSVTPPMHVPLLKEPLFWPELLWDVSLLVNEVWREMPDWQTRCAARMTALLSRSLSIAAPPEQRLQEVPEEADLVSTVDQFLRDNMHRSLTLAQIAIHAGVSERSLTRHFNESTGKTVQQYLHNLRMEQAAQLLAGSEMKISDIAAQVGIPDPAYFALRFRQRYEMTPRHYQENCRKQQQQQRAAQASTD